MRHLSLLLVLCLGAPLGAQEAVTVASSTPALERLDALVAEVLAKHEVPALGAAIVGREGVRAVGVAGTRRFGQDDPVQIDDLWHLGSCTKAMTATLCARLAAQGKLQLEAPIAGAFPDLVEKADAGWNGSTLLQLLQHRGGAPHNVPPQVWARLGRKEEDSRAGRDLLITATLEAAPAYTPGTEETYSNTGYAMAGGLCERQAKTSFEALLQQEVFQPLGIQHAGFGAPGREGRPSPCGHVRLGEGKYRALSPSLGIADNPSAITPAGRVHMTLADWGRFIAAHLRAGDGEDEILSKEAFATLHRPHEGTKNAAGWMVVHRGWSKGPILTHSGSNTMWFCVAWLAPEEGVAYLATCNLGGDVAVRATDAMVGALIRRAKGR